MSSPPPAYDHLGPYLRLSHRLSLAPFAYPIIAVAFVALRFYLSLQSAKGLIEDAKELVIASCLGAQRAASSVVSFPRWMALQTNEQIINVARDTLDASRSGLNLCLTALNKIIVFVIDVYQSFYLCLFQFLIRGGLAGIIALTKTVEDGLNSLGARITSAVGSAQSGINSAITTANGLFGRIPGFSSVSIPTMSVDVNSLDITVPDTLSSTLTNLNNSLPTLNQLRADLANLISTPFTNLQAQINSTFQDLETSTFNADVLPVPAIRTVEFCNDIDLSVIDSVGNKMITIIQSIAIALVVLMFLMMIVNLLLEWYRWNALQAAVGSIQDSWKDPSAPEGQEATPVVQLTRDNILVLHSQLDHGYRTKFLAALRRKLHLHPRTTNSMAWFIAYVTYPPALMCLLIGVLGLVVVAIQYALISPLEQEFDDLGNLIIGNYTDKVVEAINGAVQVDSAAYATEVNSWMDTTTQTINEDVFGFATVASDAINGTVIRFYHDLETGIRDGLSGTVFADSIVELLRCVIGNKILLLETGLAWLKANMHISLPRVDPAFLQVKSASVLEMAGPIGSAAATQSTDGSEEAGVLGRIVRAYKTILKGEMILFGVFLGLWCLVALSACVILIWHRLTDGRRQRQAAAGKGSATPPEMVEKRSQEA
ncbi:hypothetical protein M408DRAFT_176396 [Serendipita vermifera MAFF 305830]|uniref:Plasma membrane fusion protein PRM1 n=1 Tax=Serendipita vermifera MAFF 305830 TaxID=933852 RepID=A0A0C3AR36_SERVB|nr:hypothetical protein M408DRAFT_176396 [Serendipita vermifera MAFF 305830]